MSGSTVLRVFAFLVPAVALLLGLAQIGVLSSNWLRVIWNGNVGDSSPRTYVLSNEPLVVYIKHFISAEEASHLVALTYVLSVLLRHER